jgi:phage pi2 protein 07
MDNLTTCKICSGNACYEQRIEEADVTTYLCFGCGMSTSTLMQKDSSLVKETEEVSPDLYKDLSVEKEGLIWFPATISIPEKGMVFIDGTDKSNWSWKAAKAVRILEEEKEKYPEGQEFKVDMANAKAFGQKDFMDALDYIEFYQV